MPRSALPLFLWLLVGILAVSHAQSLFPPGPADLNVSHPQARTLRAWWLVLPPLIGGNTWFPLRGRETGLLTNMDSAAGWQGTARGDWWGEMRLGGTDDYVDLGTHGFFDFADTTVTLHLRFQCVNPGVTSYLWSKRSTDTITLGGWFVRLNAAGAVVARLIGQNNEALFERTSTGTGFCNSAWHTVTVTFVTNTVTAGNNTVSLYINGAFDSGTVTNNDLTSPYGGCAVCRAVLGTTDDLNSPLVGAVDDVRIYTGPVSAADALALARATPPTFGGLLEPPTLVGSTGARPVKRRVIIQ